MTAMGVDDCNREGRREDDDVAGIGVVFAWDKGVVGGSTDGMAGEVEARGGRLAEECQSMADKHLMREQEKSDVADFESQVEETWAERGVGCSQAHICLEGGYKEAWEEEAHGGTGMVCVQALNNLEGAYNLAWEEEAQGGSKFGGCRSKALVGEGPSGLPKTRDDPKSSEPFSEKDQEEITSVSKGRRIEEGLEEPSNNYNEPEAEERTGISREEGRRRRRR